LITLVGLRVKLTSLPCRGSSTDLVVPWTEAGTW